MPEILKQNGYYTIHAGKGHFASYSSPASNPSTIGFIKNIAGNAAGYPGGYLGIDNFGDKQQGGFHPTMESKGLEMRVEQQGMGPASTFRKGNWKLVYFYGTGKIELYNLQNDIGERTALAKKQSEITTELIILLNQKLKAQFPTEISIGKEIYTEMPKAK